MLLNSVMFNWRHPRRYLPENNKIYLSEDGVTEVEGEGCQDVRAVWRSFLDPFDLWGLVNGKRKGRENGMGKFSEQAPGEGGVGGK